MEIFSLRWLDETDDRGDVDITTGTVCVIKGFQAVIVVGDDWGFKLAVRRE